jgi:hypothetical protein
MRKLNVEYKAQSVMDLKRSRRWSRKMVYVIRADRGIRYPHQRSRVIYIGTTRKGAERPASSAADKAFKAFEDLHGVKGVEVHIVTCTRRKHLESWRLLESALLVVFKYIHGKLPHFNKKIGQFRKIDQVNAFFSEKRLRNILKELE